MAEVFKAKSFGVKGFAKIIAIKRILPHLAEDEHFVGMFIAEAKMAVQLNHANICQIYDLGRIGADHYIAMEYISGKDLLSLHNYFRRTKTHMPVHLAAYIGGRVAEGLDYAHRKRTPDGHPMAIVHRDISPQNVLISYDGAVKLIDFGIAKARARNIEKTEAGVLKGKFGYMSPEQVQGREVDHRADIFALGTVIHEMLTNARLFMGDSDFATLEMIRDARVDPPSRSNPDVPEELDRIVLKALERDRDHRYSQAGEMANALSRFMQTSGYPYSGKDLSDWMRTQFESDIEKERQKHELYAQIEGYPQSEAEDSALGGFDEDDEDDEDTALWAPDDMEALFGAEFAAPDDTDPGQADHPVGPTWVQVDEEPGPGIAGAGTNIRPELPPEPEFIDIDLEAEPTPLPVPKPVVPNDFAPRTESAPPPQPSRFGFVYWLVLASLVVSAIGGGVLAYRALEPAPSEQPAGLVLRVEPAENLSIFIDNQLVDTKSPFSQTDMAPAAYSLRVESIGYESWKETVTLKPGEIPEISVELVPSGAPNAKVRIVTEPPDAEVRINGTSVPPHQRAGYVPLPGGRPVEIEVRRDGYLTYKDTFTPASGAPRTRTIVLLPASGSLSVNSEPQGEVWLNDRKVGPTPQRLDNLDARQKWTVRIESPGHTSFERTVSFGDRQVVELNPTLRREKRR